MDHSEGGSSAVRGARIDDVSVTDLETALRRSGTCAPPQDPVPLRTALASCPGEKPWAALMTAILAGALPIHLAEGMISSRTLLVPRAEAVRFARDAASGLQPSTLTPFDCSLVPMRDACEVLSAGWEETVKALGDAGITSGRIGRGRAVERGRLLALASERISTFEFAMARGISPAGASRLLTRDGIRRLMGGWCRSEVERGGLLPTLPPSTDQRSARGQSGSPTP